MAYLAPDYLAKIGAVAPASGFTVYAVGYPDKAGNRRVRTWQHKTPKATLRKLGSLCGGGRGALNLRDDFAIFAMNAAGDTLSYYDLKRSI